MNIGCAVHGKSVVLRQLLAPLLFVMVDRPVIPVESAPKNGLAVLIQKLFGYDAAIIGFNVHDAYGIIALSADGDGISSHNVRRKSLLTLLTIVPVL